MYTYGVRRKQDAQPEPIAEPAVEAEAAEDADEAEAEHSDDE